MRFGREGKLIPRIFVFIFLSVTITFIKSKGKNKKPIPQARGEKGKKGYKSIIRSTKHKGKKLQRRSNKRNISVHPYLGLRISKAVSRLPYMVKIHKNHRGQQLNLVEIKLERKGSESDKVTQEMAFFGSLAFIQSDDQVHSPARRYIRRGIKSNSYQQFLSLCKIS